MSRNLDSLFDKTEVYNRMIRFQRTACISNYHLDQYLAECIALNPLVHYKLLLKTVASENLMKFYVIKNHLLIIYYIKRSSLSYISLLIFRQHLPYLDCQKNHDLIFGKIRYHNFRHLHRLSWKLPDQSSMAVCSLDL